MRVAKKTISRTHIFAGGVNYDLQLGDVVCHPLFPERTEDREHVGVLEYDGLVAIEAFLDNPGAPAFSGDREGEGGVDGEGDIAGCELRGQRPQIGEGIGGSGGGHSKWGVEDEGESEE